MTPRDRAMPWAKRRASALLWAVVAMTGLASAAFSQGSPFAEAEVTPSRPARCHEIKDAIRNVPTPDGLTRIDFSAVGPLSLVRFDGVLAYMGICNEPDTKVLCITYSTNDMKVGEVVNVAGSYRKVAPNYVILDPCLARQPDPIP